MKRLLIQRNTFFALAMIVFLLYANALYAAPATLKPPPEAFRAHSEVGSESLQYLKKWGCDLTSAGGGYINLSGFTEAYQSVDYLLVKLYLQCWDGTAWVDLGGYLYENHNASIVTGEKGMKVAPGYYYRIRGEHSLTHDGVTESASSYSSAYYIE